MLIPCNYCGLSDVEEIRSKDRHGRALRSVICRRCGLVWTDPRLAPDEVREFYSRQYRKEYKGSYQPRPRQVIRNGRVAIERTGRLRPFLTPGARIFDVGAGSGEMVYVLRALGYEARGLEPNEPYARYAADVLGVPVSPGFYQEAAVDPLSMDMVTMFHTVEHLENPLEAMQCARAWLKPGGVLIVEVPNVEATCQQPHQQFHRGHLYHFNIVILEMLARRAGYTVVSRYESPDGGNIAIVARNNDDVPVETNGIPGNWERVRGILNRHTALRHLFTPHPWARPVRKLAARIREQRHAKRVQSPRQALDELIRDGRP